MFAALNQTSALTDIARANILLNSFRIQENGALAALGMVDGVTDTFEDTAAVDLATSTGETHDSGNGYFHNPDADQRITGGTPTAVYGGTAANINDDTSGTVCLSTSFHPTNLTGAAVAARIAWSIDLGSIKTLSKIEAVDYRRTVGSGGAAPGLYYSEDNVTWTQAGADLTAMTTSGQTGSRTGTFSARYVAFVMGAQNWNGGDEIELADLNAYEAFAPNMVLQSDAATALSDPAEVFVVVWQEDVDSVTLNIDLVAEVSRDGGTTWSAATLVEKSAIGSGRILTGTANVSAQPSGTSIKWRLTVANNKELRVHAVGLQWG